MIASLRRFKENEVAQQRLKIIKFYEKHGEEDIIGAKNFLPLREAVTVYLICSVIPDAQKSMLT